MAVKDASAQNMLIGVLSDGHSWTASFLRDGGVLINMSKFTETVLGVEEGTAQVQPGAHGGDLNSRIRPHDYIFPSGHNPSVGVAGFLLRGAFDWNSRVLSPACESVLAVEVVTADGDLVFASLEQHEDLYWAVRGAGPGFFGIINKFYLNFTHYRRVQ